MQCIYYFPPFNVPKYYNTCNQRAINITTREF
ncbi:hypothetical protein M5D96_014122 [Drosophila gunungcola]|uniref:Uncharacterized protein n=1 Tax=Drosophila gunungcola TaxID=103775 RepID=A0A9Q0BHN7_9MUSC|nr:hypothetical protein M5D96_014122 [Drosophila gunungcola]